MPSPTLAARCRFATLVIALLAATPTQAQVWTLDTRFALDFINETNVADSVRFVPAKDGTILVKGDFTHADGVPAYGLARLNSDGSVDRTFSFAAAGLLGVAPLTEGRVLANRFSPETFKFRIVRLLADGQVDPTYPAEDASTRTLMTPIAGGGALVWEFYAEAFPAVRRYLPDGTRDQSFNPPSTATLNYIPYGVAPLADGGVLVSRGLTRLRPDGSLDATFRPSGLTFSPSFFAAQADGKILYEDFEAVVPSGATRPIAYTTTLRRMHIDGAPDQSFLPTLAGGPQAIAVLPEGRIAVQVAPVGTVTSTSGAFSPASTTVTIQRATVLILNKAGEVERDLRTQFGAANDVQLLGAEADGRVIVRYGPPLGSGGPLGGDSNDPVATVPGAIPIIRPRSPYLASFTFARVRPDNLAEQRIGVRFTQGASHGGRAYQLSPDAAGRPIAIGPFTVINGQPRSGIARFLPGGTLDPTFLPAYTDRQDTTLSLLLAQADGKLILQDSVRSGTGPSGLPQYTPRVFRLREDGREDTSFTPSAMFALSARWLVSANDGRLLVATFEPTSSRESIVKLFWLGSDGRELTALPTEFGSFEGVGPLDTDYRTITSNLSSAPFPFAVRLQADGKLLVSGGFKRVNGLDCLGLIRLLPDGQFDTTYKADLAGFSWLPLISMQPDGRALAMGTDFSTGRAVTRLRRLLANGSRDSSFPEQPGLAYWPPQLGSDGQPEREAESVFKRPDGTEINIYRPILAGDGSRWAITSERGGNLLWNSIARLLPQEFIGIIAQPQNQTIVAGRALDLSVSVGTSRPATYQWMRDGSPLAGATSAVLSIPAVATSDAGLYQVRVTIGSQAFASAGARLSVAPSTARLTNLSARGVVTPESPQNAGLVVATASARTVLMRAIGRGLPVNDTSNLLPVPVLTLYDGNRIVANDRGGALAPAVAALARSVGAFPLSAPAGFGANAVYGSALMPVLGSGAFTATTTSEDGASGIALLEFYDTGAASMPPLMRNLSLRGVSAPGSGVLTAGFVIGGIGPMRLLVRGIGPALASFGILGAIADPVLRVYSSDISTGTLALADAGTWGNDPVIADAARRTGAFALPAASRDAAVLLALEPGAYTAQLSSATGATGTAMIEIYVVER